MKDFLGKEVQVSDEVVIIEPGYHDFVRGVIVKFTPKGVKVKYHRFCSNSVEETFVGDGGFIKVELEKQLKNFDLISHLKADIESLEKENLRKAMIFNTETIKRVYTEARKEFAERLKEMFLRMSDDPWNLKAAPPSWAVAYDSAYQDIDNLLEEMESESK